MVIWLTFVTKKLIVDGARLRVPVLVVVAGVEAGTVLDFRCPDLSDAK